MGMKSILSSLLCDSDVMQHICHKSFIFIQSWWVTVTDDKAAFSDATKLSAVERNANESEEWE